MSLPFLNDLLDVFVCSFNSTVHLRPIAAKGWLLERELSNTRKKREKKRNTQTLINLEFSKSKTFVFPFETKNLTLLFPVRANPRTFKGSSSNPKPTLQVQGKSF